MPLSASLVAPSQLGAEIDISVADRQIRSQDNDRIQLERQKISSIGVLNAAFDASEVSQELIDRPENESRNNVVNETISTRENENTPNPAENETNSSLNALNINEPRNSTNCTENQLRNSTNSLQNELRNSTNHINNTIRETTSTCQSESRSLHENYEHHTISRHVALVIDSPAVIGYYNRALDTLSTSSLPEYRNVRNEEPPRYEIVTGTPLRNRELLDETGASLDTTTTTVTIRESSFKHNICNSIILLCLFVAVIALVSVGLAMKFYFG